MSHPDGGRALRDAIIVGAGPAGSATAALLARSGLDVLLLERAVAGLPAKVCGEYLSPGCLPLLRRLGALPSLRDAGRPLFGTIIRTPAHRVLRAHYSNPATPPARRICGLSVTRARLDPALLDLAIESGATVESGFLVQDVRHEGGLVRVTGRLGGRPTDRRARVVVGADGRHSAVAHRLGAVHRHPWLDKMALVAHVTGVERDEDVAEVFLGSDRYAILNPIADGLTNVGVVASRRDLPGGEDPRRSLWRTARRMPGLGDRLHAARFAAPPRCLGPLAHRASVLAGPATLLVGDAAGFLDPFTGEGIYAALRSAELAAHRILSAWTSGGPRADALAAYAGEWRREFAPKFRLATHLQQLIRSPRLAEVAVALLARRPALAVALLRAAGDLVPPGHLSLWRLIASRSACPPPAD